MELTQEQQDIMEAAGMTIPTQKILVEAPIEQTLPEPEPVAEEIAVLLDKYPSLYQPTIMRDFVEPAWANLSMNYWLKSTMPATLFTGPRGTGKGTVIEQIAAKAGYLVLKIEFNDDVTPDELVGTPRFSMSAGEGGDWFQSGPFMILSELDQAGVKVILFCDEFNVTSPSAQMTFNSLTDKSGGFYCKHLAKRMTLKRPKIAFACNEGYTGTRDIAKNLRDRLIPQFATYLPAADESELIQRRTGCKKRLADKLVKAANIIRAAAAGQSDGTQIDFDMSPRPLFEIGELIGMGMDENEAWQTCVIGRAGNSIRTEGTRMVLANLSKTAGFKVTV